jgi:periplasmic divalent cation tolerance protein
VSKRPCDPRRVLCLAFALALIIETNDCRRMTDEKLIISTAGSKEEASRIAHALVEQRLAACVNIVGPIDSVYRWQEKIESAPEFLLLIKSTSAKAAMAAARIRDLHSYDLPEAIEINIDGGSADYLKWIAENC